MAYREIGEIRTAHPSQDGDGVVIHRISGMRHAGMDPVLMLDELRSEYRDDFAGGFPPHPHRGMQTLTYMKQGGLIHEDNQGNRGEIRGGGAQWMSAGRGVIHSEMPTQDTTGLHGFQLWFNLPAKDKMSEPHYRDLPAQELAQLPLPQGHAIAIAGDWMLDGSTLSGPLQELSAAGALLDIQLEAGATLELGKLAGANVLVYVYDGSWVYDGSLQIPQLLTEKQMAVTGEGDQLKLVAGESGVGALLLKGEAIGEPVAHYGPFVMNTQDEIEQTIQDYQAGRFTA